MIVVLDLGLVGVGAAVMEREKREIEREKREKREKRERESRERTERREGEGAGFRFNGGGCGGQVS